MRIISTGIKQEENRMRTGLYKRLSNAFFAESGLVEYGNDEVLVDWMAKQLPKIQETVEKIIKVDYFEEG